MAISGVYRIRNMVNGKVYIGSAADIEHRWSQHQTDLRRGVHSNSRLQRAWQKYGEAAFDFEIIERVDGDPRMIQVAEQTWLDKTHCYCDRIGYNINPTADGLVRSAETCAKISAAKQGEGHHMHKLTRRDVEVIKARLVAGEMGQVVAQDFGVAPATIGDIRRGATWTHVPWPNGQLPKDGKMGEGRYNARLTSADVVSVKSALIAGETTWDIARQYGVTQATVADIKWGRTWKQIPWSEPFTPRRDGTLAHEQVADIRRRLTDGERGRRLAQEFGVSEQTISAIKTGRLYN